MFRFLPLLTLALALSGCVSIQSREPLYDRAKESTFNAGYAGTWSNDAMRWTIEPGNPDGTMVKVECFDSMSQDEPKPCPADLVAIGSWRYMFIRSPEADGAAAAHMLPALRLKREWNVLTVDWLIPDALAKRLDSGTTGLDYQWQDRPKITPSNGELQLHQGTVTINAPAKDIRRYLERHEGDSDLFVNLARLNRE